MERPKLSHLSIPEAFAKLNEYTCRLEAKVDRYREALIFIQKWNNSKSNHYDKREAIAQKVEQTLEES